METTELHKLLEAVRATGQVNPQSIFDAALVARGKGLSVGYYELAPWLERASPEFWPLPSGAYAFLSELLECIDAKRLIDPFAVAGTLAVACAELNKQLDVSAVCRTPDEFGFVNSFSKSLNVLVRVRLADSLTEVSSELYDTVLSFPTIGGLKVEQIYSTADGDKTICEPTSKHMIITACKLIEENGKAIFIVPRAFGNGPDARFYSTLQSFGFHLHAVFEWGEATFSRTSLPMKFIVIGRTPQVELFVAQLAQDSRVNKAILESWRKMRDGRSPELGRVVKHSSFTSIAQITADERLEHLAKDWGSPVVMLGQILTRIFRVTSAEKQSDIANALYIPLIGRSNVVTNIGDLVLKPQNYTGVALVEEQAINQFVAQFLNTEVGRSMRDSLTSGTFIPKLSSDGVSKIQILLPTIDTQLQVIKLQSLVSNRRAELELLQNSLWLGPRALETLEEKLGDDGEAEAFESWLETLPFALASILWTYHVAADDAKRVQHLLHFFEALAEFFAIFFLSGFAKDSTVYKQYCHLWIDRKNPRYQDLFVRSSFGSWSILSGKLASALRKAFKADDEATGKLKAEFGNPSTSFWDCILQKELFTLIQDVSTKRNEWMGHTGYVSDRENYRRRILLEADLAIVRHLFSGHFSRAQFLLPQTSRFSNGVFSYSAKLLRGSRPGFRTIDVQTNMPMEENQMHFLFEGERSPLAMLPLIRMHVNTSSDLSACYFYNRRNGDGEQRFVSYHSSTESEFTVPDEQVDATLKLLASDFGLD